MQPIKPDPVAPNTSLVEQVQARREQLQRGLTADTLSKATRADIEAALATVAPMLTGDLTKVPEMVSRDLSRWLESSKYIGVQAKPSPSPPALPVTKAEDTNRPAGSVSEAPPAPADKN